MNEDRIPPHDLATERSVLKSCMMAEGPDDWILRIAFEMVEPEDFYSPQHNRIYAAMKLNGTGDLQIIRTSTQNVNEALTDVLGQICSPANIEAYCQRLLTLAAQRKAQIMGHDLVDAAKTEPPEELADRIEQVADAVRAKGPQAVSDPVKELYAELDEAVAGLRYSAPMPWETLMLETRALLPGMVTILCGTPGATKSLAAIQLVRHLRSKQIAAAYLALEHGASFHLRRAAAQILGISDITDDSWCRANPEKVEEIKLRLGPELEELRRAIDAPNDQSECNVDSTLAWIRSRCRSNRVLIVDPITIMETGSSPWIEDKRFLRGAKQLIKQSGSSLLLVTHPRKLQAGMRATGMDDVAGGVSYSRFSQTVLLLSAHDEKEGTVEYANGSSIETYNRTMKILKATNGRGCEGHNYAFRFDAKSLTLKELGRVRKMHGPSIGD